MIDELISQFSPGSFSEWCREKFDRFTADPHAVSDPGDFEKAEVVGYVQSLPEGDTNRPLLVMAVHAGAQINERSSRRKQFDFARKQLQGAIDKPPAKVKGLFTQGLFAFYDNTGNFRLSLVSGRAEGKKLVYSDFKRQSFFVKPDRNNKTFRARTESAFGAYQDLTAAFSVETLTREFYNTLFAWYERAMSPKSKVTFPNDMGRDDDDRNLLAEHLIRLITRLMFVWFIRQKDLVPETLFDTDALKRLLKDFDPISPNQDHYYRAILQNLFFATLNCEIQSREFAVEGTKEENKEQYGVKLLYRYRDDFSCPPADVIRLFRSVPFLNGGLFECLDKKRDDSARSPVLYHDGFSREAQKRAHIPNNLFFDEQGLITLFAHYDFTVDENDPNDADVALDPELLGKVFENLLGAYNPETRATARNQSGSFYTPREIVNYMVDESLVAHLRTTEVDEPIIRMLLGHEDPPALPDSVRRNLVARIYHCRILDPACGSGAFPMGLLLKMVHLLQRLDPRNTLWHEVVVSEAEKELHEAEMLDAKEKRLRRQRITDSFDQNVNQPDYARKLYLIENCIFGVDIQPIAVQIAKLRAFITLVCDQAPDPDNIAGNYGMLPLPNLETKFVAANSLIGLSTDFADGLKSAEGDSRLDDPILVQLRSELAEVRHQHFRARTAIDKNDCRKRDRELRAKIKAQLVEIASKPDAAKIARFLAEIASLQLKRKAVEREDWQDVLRADPIQPNLFEAPLPVVQTMLHMDVNKENRDKFDEDIRRHKREIEIEENRAKNKSAFRKEADRLADWDPYDQNKSSPFFDPKWMFDVKDGFDIVIGNPPYGISFDGQMQEMLKSAFTTYSLRGESYVLFIEKSIQMLLGTGQLAFIVPDTYLNLGFTQLLRDYLLAETHIMQIYALPAKVFAAATVDTTLLFVSRVPNNKTHLDYPIRVRRLAKTETKLDLCCPLADFAVNADVWRRQKIFNVYSSPIESSILDRVDSQYASLRTYADVLSGVKVYEVGKGTPPQSVRVLATKPFTNESRKDDTWSPFLEGKHIVRYANLWNRDNWIKYGTWLAAPRDEDRFKGEKLLVRKIVDRRLTCTLVTECTYCNTLLFIVKTKKPQRIQTKYLLGILCSSFIGWYFRKRFQISNADTFPQIMARDILQFPIPVPSEGEQTEVSTVVNCILAEKEEDPTVDTSAWEQKIDKIVYRLYSLTPDEIAIVEEQESRVKQTPTPAKPAKAGSTQKKTRKSVMTEDPDLA